MHFRNRGRHRLHHPHRIRAIGATLAVVAAGLTGLVTATTASAQSQASFTAIDMTVDGANYCANGGAKSDRQLVLMGLV